VAVFGSSSSLLVALAASSRRSFHFSEHELHEKGMGREERFACLSAIFIFSRLLSDGFLEDYYYFFS
jgi:hypothetical protein